MFVDDLFLIDENADENINLMFYGFLMRVWGVNVTKSKVMMWWDTNGTVYNVEI